MPTTSPEIRKRSSREDILRSLEAFVLDDGLRRLEQDLGKFNLFTTLNLHANELVHSRMLGWLLSPDASHGLGDLFLRRWLMRVLHNVEKSDGKRPGVIQIESAKWGRVEVYTEWRPPGAKDRLDLLLNLTTDSAALWQIAIEMKVGSTQADGQLAKYRAALVKEFPKVEHQILLFLTKDEEEPAEDSGFIGVSFAELKKAIEECLAERGGRIGEGPRGLIENYLNLIQTWFMDDSEIAVQAQQIYSKHRDALELLFQYRPDVTARLTEGIKEELIEQCEALQIIVTGSVRGFVYFVAKHWGDPVANPNNEVLYCQLETYYKKARLRFVLEALSEDWPELLEDAKKAPFKRQGKPKAAADWTTLHSIDLGVRIEEDDEEKTKMLASKITSRLAETWKARETQRVITSISEHITRRRKFDK